MDLDIETVELVAAIRLSINTAPLGSIHLYKNGKRIRLSKKVVKEFELTGLNNYDFFAYKIYKKR